MLFGYLLNQDHSLWTGAFSIDQCGEFAVKLWHHDLKRRFISRVRVQEQEGSTFVVLYPEDPKCPLYRIVNQSDLPIKLQQSLVSGSAAKEAFAPDKWPWTHLLPGHSCIWAWDELNLSSSWDFELLLQIADRAIFVKMDILSGYAFFVFVFLNASLQTIDIVLMFVLY